MVEHRGWSGQPVTECGEDPAAGHAWMWFRRRESARMLRDAAGAGWVFPEGATLAYCPWCDRFRVHARGFEMVLHFEF